MRAQRSAPSQIRTSSSGCRNLGETLGKFMRRTVRKIAEGDYEHLFDVSTLGDPHFVKDMVYHRATR